MRQQHLIGSAWHGALATSGREGFSGFLEATAHIRRLTFLCLAAGLVFGCAATRSGTSFMSITQNVGPPKAGQSRIVLLRNKGYSGIVDAGWPVELDGAPFASLKTGTFAYADRPAGRHQLSLISSDFPRPSRHDVATAPGRTYFFRVEQNEKGRMIAAGSTSAGLAGLLVTSAMSAAADDRGTFDFVPLDEGVARQTLSDLALSD
jgi:hypothetical protein